MEQIVHCEIVQMNFDDPQARLLNPPIQLSVIFCSVCGWFIYRSVFYRIFRVRGPRFVPSHGRVCNKWKRHSNSDRIIIKERKIWPSSLWWIFISFDFHLHSQGSLLNIFIKQYTDPQCSNFFCLISFLHVEPVFDRFSCNFSKFEVKFNGIDIIMTGNREFGFIILRVFIVYG